MSRHWHYFFLFATVLTVSWKTGTAKVCPARFTSAGNSCYYLKTSRNSWEASAHACRQLQGHLVVINDRNEQHTVTGLIASLNDGTQKSCRKAASYAGFWTAGHRSGRDFVWQPFGYSGRQLGINYANWAKGEPNNIYRPEDCVNIATKASKKWNYTWNDAKCTLEMCAICEHDLLP